MTKLASTAMGPEGDSEEVHPYRAVSKAAVAALILALFGQLGWLAPTLLFFAFLAMMFGFVAQNQLRQYPDELTGQAPARIGLILGAITLFSGISYHSYVYATEVPEGYQRISFAVLQPSPENPREKVPEDAVALNDERIFVKGYIHPSVAGMGPVKTFVLVPDMGTCCFGGQPKLTEMIEVTMSDDLVAEYARTRRRLAGTLKVDTRLKPVSGLQGVYYQLECDYIK